MSAILIIDDDPAVRAFLRSVLSEAHRPVEAANAYEAMALFDADPPDLIVADIAMPGMDGFSFLRQLRVHPAGRTMPVIIHTGLHLDEQTRDLACACGVEHLLEKPCSSRTILAAVQAALASASPAVDFPAEFERAHLRLLADQLVKKIRELHEEVRWRRQLEDSLQETAARLKLVSRRVIEIQETERRALAHELHDEIGQVLCAVSVNLKIVRTKVDASLGPRLDESVTIVDEAIQRIRNRSLDLHPSVLDESGLHAALRWYIGRLSQRTGLEIRLEAIDVPADLPVALRTACFRVAQEALTNVTRHARARHVWIELAQREAQLSLSIRDDGVGFDVAAARSRAVCGGSLGLLGMQERIEMLGGSFTIVAEPGRGTAIHARVPVDKQADPP